MKRFEITNQRNGLKFAVEAEALPPRQPEWGPPGKTKLKVDCDDWETQKGKTAGPDEFGNELWSVPDSMLVKETDITAELAAAAAENAKVADAIARMEAYDDDSASPAQMKQFRKDVRLLLKALVTGLKK